MTAIWCWYAVAVEAPGEICDRVFQLVVPVGGGVFGSESESFLASAETIEKLCKLKPVSAPLE